MSTGAKRLNKPALALPYLSCSLEHLYTVFCFLFISLHFTHPLSTFAMLLSRSLRFQLTPWTRVIIAGHVTPRPYTTAAPVPKSISSSTDGNKRQHRYLQTITAHRPVDLVGVGVSPPRNADAPLSSLTGQEAYPAHPPRAPVMMSTSSKLSVSTPTPVEPVKAQPKATPTAPRTSKLRAPRKSAMSLTPAAVAQLRALLDSPDPKLIRVGVKNRGCSGLAYHLEYVEKPGKFDEEVVQDGVRVLIDSKALFSIIGSEMDWVEDKLSARFVFKNPNISK